MLKKFKRTLGFIHQHELAKKNRLKAYINLIIWQIQISFNRNLIEKHFIGEVNFLAKKGLTGITGNIYVGLHEFNDMGFLLHFLREEDTFFDIGANVGSYTLLASGYVGSKTFAFEPVPGTFELLTKNVDLNHLSSKATLHNIALGSKKGQLKFSSTLDTVNHVIAENETDHQAINVNVNLLDEFKNYKPTLLKIDVEGFETEVINGGAEVLKNDHTKAIVIELNGSGDRYGYKEENIHNYLKSLGYLPYQYYPLNRLLVEITDFGSHNTIYIKDIDFVQNRCNTADLVTALNVTF